MRRLRIQHVTEYRFSSQVTLNQHRLLLRPREGHDVHIESSRLEISPAYRIQWYRDVFDNSLALVDFQQTTNVLRIVSEVVIQHYEEETLRYTVEPYALNYPFFYQENDSLNLAPFQQPVYQQDQPAVWGWLKTLGLVGGPIKTSILESRLNRAIQSQFRYQAREEPGVQSPARTLMLGSGSCRDYANLFIEACRCLGLASRFVSGYLHAPATEAGNATTHAWAEVFLPGLGWQGYDPTIGEVTHHRHIAVAVARNAESVPPVSGSFLSSSQSRPNLFVNVQVNLLGSAK